MTLPRPCPSASRAAPTRPRRPPRRDGDGSLAAPRPPQRPTSSRDPAPAGADGPRRDALGRPALPGRARDQIPPTGGGRSRSERARANPDGPRPRPRPRRSTRPRSPPAAAPAATPIPQSAHVASTPRDPDPSTRRNPRRATACAPAQPFTSPTDTAGAAGASGFDHDRPTEVARRRGVVTRTTQSSLPDTPLGAGDRFAANCPTRSATASVPAVPRRPPSASPAPAPP